MKAWTSATGSGQDEQRRGMFLSWKNVDVAMDLTVEWWWEINNKAQAADLLGGLDSISTGRSPPNRSIAVAIELQKVFNQLSKSSETGE